MKSTKKKIVALSTAFVMAFALVVAMLPATVSEANLSQKYIYPDGFIGTGAEGEAEAHGGNYIANIAPTSEYTSIEKGEGNTIIITGLTAEGEMSGLSYYASGTWTFKFVGTNSIGFMISEMGQGTLNVSVAENSTLTVGKVVKEDGCGITVAEGTTVSKDISGATYDNPVENVTFTGPTGGGDQGGGDQGGGDQGGGDQGGDADQGGSADQTPATPASSTTTSTVTTLTEGASATIAQADDGTVTFRYDKPLSYFANGGELYIDGNKIARDKYEYYEGSTIIKLGKELASKLADGAEHAIKVVFNDGTEVNSKITVTPNAAASATVAPATTTKVKSPKTADVLPFVGIAVVFVGASAVAFVVYRRKNS